MKKIQIITTALICITLFSCKKAALDEINAPDAAGNLDIAAIIKSYQALNESNVHGKFYVQSITINDQSNTNTAQIGGAFYDDNGNTFTGSKVNIGSLELTPTNNFYGFTTYLEREPFFGHEVSFIINKNSTTSNPAASIYIPQIITAHVNVTASAYELTWNADAQNNKGIVIVAEYSPGLTGNEGISLRTPLRKSILTSDNGSASLDKSWFNDFPRKSTIILHVARGNYRLINQNDILIGGYTANAMFSFVMPS